MVDECDGHDHRLEHYAARDRRLLSLVESFNRRLVGALAEGRDLAATLDALDPDPARYTWVDEGGGVVEAVLADAEEALRTAPRIPGFRLAPAAALPTGAPSARPALAADPAGGLVVAWVEWSDHEGERVVVVRTDGSGQPTTEPCVVSGPLGDCLRPSVAVDGDGNAWVLFGLRRHGEVGIWSARSAPGSPTWEPPEPLSATAHPSFNQEVVRLPDGRLEVCWQGWVGDRFAVFGRRSAAAGGWGPTQRLSGASERNVWDPTVACHASGAVAHAWTTYGGGTYRTSVLVEGPDGERDLRVLAAPGAYALHPSLAFDADGKLWCAHDEVALGGHAGSGPTRLRPRAELGAPRQTGSRPDGRAVPGDLSPDVRATVTVTRFDGELRAHETGPVGAGALVSPAGLPRLAATAGGEVAVAYRALRRLPLMLYYWDTVVEWHGTGGWGGLTTFDHADGPLEEAAVVADGDQLALAWQEDGRKGRELAWTEGFGGEECIRRREHYGEVVWHTLHTGGRIRAARLAAPDGHPERDGPVVARPVRDPAGGNPPPAESRPWVLGRDGAPEDRYRAAVDGRELALYWGDLHRHSLVSRCTAGDEPALDDFYRYSFDVCEYDFWAVTDHAENTSAYQWWSIQKLADVLNVPGRFVPFYGFEWTAATGHQNVIYESRVRDAPIFSSTAAGSTTPAQLWEHLRDAGQRSLTIPHHPGSAMVPFDWSYHGEDLLRLVEVFQACRGNYEADGCFRQYSDGTLAGTFMTDGLRQGHRFGLIASSDHGNGASFVGAFAEELTRDSVFAALHARRTMAATTRDVVVELRVNDTFMGGVADPAPEAAVTVHARGYRDLARVDLVVDGSPSRTVEAPLDLAAGEVAVGLRVEWTTGEAPRTDWSGSLHVSEGRIVDTAYWSPEIVDVGADSVRWSAETRNFRSQYGAQRGGIELTVAGPPSAPIAVETGGGSGASTLGALVGLAAGQGVELARGPGGVLRLQPGTGGLRSLGVSRLTRSWAIPVARPTWIYARVTLEDGEMAWSSPVWIDPA